jgi:hypothetical protein
MAMVVSKKVIGSDSETMTVLGAPRGNPARPMRKSLGERRLRREG